MTATVFFIVAASVALALILWLAKGRALALSGTEHPETEILPVDIQAFRTLVDPTEEAYLRRALPGSEFRSIQRERLFAAIEYVRCVAHNAAVLMVVGETARHSQNPTVVEAGNKLVSNALHLRLFAFQALAKLYFGIVFPGSTLPEIGISEDYERTTRLGVLLKCLKRPTGAISTALMV